LVRTPPLNDVKRDEISPLHAPRLDHALCNAKSLALCERAASEK